MKKPILKSVKKQKPLEKPKKIKKSKPMSAYIAYAITAVIFAIIALVLFAICTEEDDSETVKLPNNYSITKYDYRDVRMELTTTTEDGEVLETVIEPLIIAYSIYSDFVAVKVVPVPESSDVSPNFSDYSYYIIDTTKPYVYGPLDEDVFPVKCEQLGNLQYEDWFGI